MRTELLFSISSFKSYKGIIDSLYVRICIRRMIISNIVSIPFNSNKNILTIDCSNCIIICCTVITGIGRKNGNLITYFKPFCGFEFKDIEVAIRT